MFNQDEATMREGGAEQTERETEKLREGRTRVMGWGGYG